MSEITRVLRTGHLPLYPGEPIRDVGSLLRFLAWLESQSLSLLAHWPVKSLVLHTGTSSLDRTQEILLQHVGLSYPGN